MVLGVCRRMLSDPHDVDDAFQATFLVLVRKAGSIRDRDLVAAWLHGVASKVARRARADSARRKAREKVATVPEAIEDGAGVESGWFELRALIDEEIERLPEAHRRAVVLCDVEGLSREEAALRLGWTLNMVRGRLERARGRLRGRLARRGVAPSGAWMVLMVAPPVPSPSLLSTTIRASLAFSSGRMATGLASASAVALSQGVLRMMMLSKLKVGLAVLVSAGFVAGGSGMLAAQGPGDRPGAEAAKARRSALLGRAESRRRRTRFIRLAARPPNLAKARIDRGPATLQDATGLLYVSVLDLLIELEGRITIDRLADSSRGLMATCRDSDAAATKAARVEAVRAHYDRVKEILKKEEAELKAGRATVSDVNEIKTGLLDAEFALAKEFPRGTPEAWKPAASATRRPGRSRPPRPGRAWSRNGSRSPDYYTTPPGSFTTNAHGSNDVGEVQEAAVTLAKAEEGAARTKADRVAAVRAQVDRLKEFVALNEARVQQARGTILDVDQARLRLLDAESHLLDVSGTPDGAGDLLRPGAPSSPASVGAGIPGLSQAEGRAEACRSPRPSPRSTPKHRRSTNPSTRITTR